MSLTGVALTKSIVLDAGTTAVTANASGSDVAYGNFQEGIATIDCAAVAGTSPTVVVKIQGKNADGTYTDLYTSAAITATGRTKARIAGCYGNLRVNYSSFGGSATPSLTLVVGVVGLLPENSSDADAI